MDTERSPDDRLRSLHDGYAAEEFVASALEASGWRVLDRNWRGAGGELDVVVLQDAHLRFVEVKARSAGDASGWEAVGPRKRRRLIRAARAWLLGCEVEWEDAVFDVALVELGPDGPGIHWIHHAFDA